MGTVWRIHMITEHEGPPQEVDTVIADAGKGLRGDRHYGHPPGPIGDLSLVEAEALAVLESEQGHDLSDGRSRRNVITRDIDLGLLVGRRFRVGEVVCEGRERCHPCVHLASMTIPQVLRNLFETGLRATILQGGTVRVGDTIELIEESEPAPAGQSSATA
jgi:MOSC domain-containing protein YiiM